MVRVGPEGLYLPALAGIATGLGILWTFDAGVVGSGAVGLVGFALSGTLSARSADPGYPWTGVLVGGCVAGLAAAVPVMLLVDLWTNFCLLDCGPVDHGPALRWGFGVLAGSIFVHALAGRFVEPRQEPEPPLPELPE